MKFKLLALCCLSLLTGCKQEGTANMPVLRPAMTVVVGQQGANQAWSYSGEVRARHEVQQGFRLGGKVAARLVEVGQSVTAGQVLARLDVTDAALQTSAAEAQLKLAQVEAERYRNLHAKKFISQSALDAKETALQAAIAQAGLARNQSGYTELRAERAGVVTATLAEVGQVVAAGQAVVKLAQDGEREVAIAVPEAQFAQLKVGDVAEISLFAGNAAQTWPGRLRELSPAADPVTRTYPARITLSGAAPALGMTATVRFVARNAPAARLVIPLTAVFQQGKNTAVWIVGKDQSVHLQTVSIAAYRDDGAVIASGLQGGERIVSNGVHRLSHGEKIQPLDASQQP